VKDQGNGHYICKYITDFVGEVRISMTFDGEDIKGTPLTVAVGVAPVCWVEGATAGLVGRTNKFTILSRDAIPGKQPVVLSSFSPKS